MDPFPNTTPHPALPPHLNPHCQSQRPIGRRFYVYNGPSPLRQSHVPGDSASLAGQDIIETSGRGLDTHVCPVSSSSSASRNFCAFGPPPGLEATVRNSLPEAIRQAIDNFHEKVESAFYYANKGKLSREHRRLTLTHTGLCLKTVDYYVEEIRSHLEKTYSDVAASQSELLEVELRGFMELRRLIKELPTS